MIAGARGMVLAWMFTLWGWRGLHAQAAPCPPATGETFPRCAVDVPATLRAASALPSFPQVLSSDDSAYVIRVSFEIDTMGRAVRASLAVDSAAHPALGIAIRNALARLRFVPARKNNQVVRQRYLAEFVLYASGMYLPTMPPDSTSRVRVLPDGTEQIVVGRTVRDAEGAASLSRGDLSDAARAAMSRVVASARKDGAGDTALTRASGSNTPALPRDQEPAQLRVARVEPWSATRVYVSITRTSDSDTGSQTVNYVCAVLRASSVWTAYCGTTTVRVTLRPWAVP